MTSKATKRKYVEQEVLNRFVLPDSTHRVMKVGKGCGNNLHEVEGGDGERFLASMPTKFRRNIWIKKGDYVMVESIEEGNKVKGEINLILLKDQVKFIQDRNLWPESFLGTPSSEETSMISADMLPPSGSESDDSDRETEDGTAGQRFAHHGNPNRRPLPTEEELESSD